MAIAIDPDLHRSSSHRNMVEHLAGPIAAGAQDTVIDVDSSGNAAVGWNARHPLLVAAPREPLDDQPLELTATLPGGDERVLTFAPYTEAGAFLPVHWPGSDPATGTAAPFTVGLAVAGVAAADVAAAIEVRVVEGVMGRMIYLLGAEKQRLRREARELAAAELLARGRDDALDRVGGELGVARFLDFPAGTPPTVVREDDDDYRRRLGLYRPWLKPNKRRLLELLNGPGADADPNAGPLAGLGVTDRFSVVEDENPFAVAVQLVAAGDPPLRDNFIAFVRAAHLLWPKNDAAANAVHAARFLPAARIQREDALRTDLRGFFSFTAEAATNPAIAPLLAPALVRAARCRAALGVTRKWPMLRAQRSDGGSRYELGLGGDLEPFPAAELDAMAASHPTATSTDPEVDGLLRSMTPQSSTDDPDGRWLLEPCGLRTVHRVDSTRVYVSHFPTYGLVLGGPPSVPAGGFAQIVRGYFGHRRFSGDFYLYDRAAGEAQFVTTDLPSDTTHVLRTLTGWRKTWTRIVPAHLTTGAVKTDLLFYDRAAGQIELWATDSNGGVTKLGATVSTRKTWTEVVTADFGFAGGLSGVLLYDRLAGEAEFHRIAAGGAMTKVGKTLTGLRKSWTAIVAGDFGGDGPGSDLFFYDSHPGEGEFHSTDGHGETAVLRTASSFSQSWTHVVPGHYVESERTDLLLYDSRTGALEIHATGPDSSLSLVGSPFQDERGWTAISAGDHGGGFSHTLFYDRTRGVAEFRVTDGAGGLELRRRESNWRKTAGQPFEAHYNAPGDPGSNVVLASGLAGALADWTAAGRPAWTTVTDPTQQAARWDAATAPNAAARNVFSSAGLPVVLDPTPVVAQLKKLPAELVATLELPTAQSQAIIAGGSTAATQLREFVEMLRSRQIASALPFVAGPNRVVIVTSVVALPEAGINLTEQPSTGFRWYVVPIDGAGGQIRAIGPRTEFVPAGEGLSAIVTLGYARQGLTDPYEYRIELPEGAVITMPQYEFLMNLLEQTYPVGVRVNTYSIRKRHVDVDGDGDADELDPSVSRTYRTFRRRRNRGEPGPTETDSNGG